MERILIVGCPGAGKSTLARQMAKKLDLPLIHLDSLFWLPGWKERDRDQFDQMLFEELRKPKWIIDGNYGRTLSARLESCDTVIFLDFGPVACVWGVLKRFFTQRGKVRPDMGEGCPERLDWAFLRYVWSFRKTNREKILSRISAAPDAVVRTILPNRHRVKKFLETV